MATFKKMDPKELDGNFIKMIADEYMLVAAEKENRVNMLTASWGGVGCYWSRPVAISFIRPQRYTKGLIDAAPGYSLNLLGPGYRDEFALCGSKSGRDIDKVEECGFTVLHEDGIPFFAEARIALICKHIFAQPMTTESFLNPAILDTAYPQRDYHTIYISEIAAALVRE